MKQFYITLQQHKEYSSSAEKAGLALLMHTNHIPINHIPDSSLAINKFLSIHTVFIRRKDHPINIRMDNTPLGPFLKISHGHWIRGYGY